MTAATLTDPRPAPSPAKLSEGWHFTDKYDDVFVAPGGSAWIVRVVNERLVNVGVAVKPSDIVKTPSIDRLKHAQSMRRARKV